MKARKTSAVKQGLEDALLDAAETLFGRHGLEGVSLRQIALAAGSSNHFAVQYHFQDKETFLRAIFERRLHSLEARRGPLLQTLFSEGRQQDTRALVEVMLLPIADETDKTGHRSYASFLMGLRLFSDLRDLWAGSVGSAPLTTHLSGLIHASVGHLPKALFLERMQAALTVFLATVVDCERRAVADPTLREGDEENLQRAIDFGVSGITAPC